MNSFNDFSLREELTRAVADLGFENPTPIQQKVIPALLSNPVDIIGLAQTGTGKTAAFGLPLLHYTDVNKKNVQCLVLSPTRELCMQIQNEFTKYGAHLKGFKTVAVYGGVPITGQMRELRYNPQVVVATPGRLIDLLERKAISLEHVEYVVLDEADEMLNMGFRDDIEFILKSTEARKYTWLFSATMNNDVRRIAKNFMSDWQEFAVAAANTGNENIDHQYYTTHHSNRFETLQRLLDVTPGIYGIIFTRTRQDCQEVSEKLMRQGYHVSPLHGDMDQKMRSKVMERFKNRTLQAIVATDVAARGIDVNDITHVINYELPDDPEVYTHRSGRTARAGKSGICMSIVTPKEISNIRQIERMIKSRFIKCDIPDGQEVVRRKLFFHLDQIANATPADDFAATYNSLISEKLENISKDDLIHRLLWLQLKDAIAEYENAEDLNAGGFERKDGGDRGSRNSVRLFINLGQKDGLTPGKFVQYIAEATDIDQSIIDRVTVRDLSSFFNVPRDVAEYISTSLSAKKFNGRRIRIEEAEQGPRGGSRSSDRGFGGRGGDRERNSHYGSSRDDDRRGNRSSRGSERSRDFSSEKNYGGRRERSYKK